MATTDAYGEYVGLSDAARIAHLSKSTILRAEQAGKIQAVRTPGGHRRFLRTDVETLMGGTRKDPS